MSNTSQRTLPPAADDTRDGRTGRPARRRRILLVAVAAFATLGLVAFLVGGDISNPAPTTVIVQHHHLWTTPPAR